MTSTTSATRNGSTDSGGPLRRFVGAPFRTETYTNLLYLLLAFPLGVAYFTIVVTGLSFGVGASLTLVGVPVLVLTFVGIIVLGALESRLASSLVDVDVALPEALRRDDPDGMRRRENGLVDALVNLFTATTTYGALALVFLKFVYGVLVFTVLVTAAALTASLLGAPFVYDQPNVAYTVGSYTIETLGEAIAASGVGVLVGFVSINLLNGLAAAGGHMTAALMNLGRNAERTA